jgi:hypothetical protein
MSQQANLSLKSSFIMKKLTIIILLFLSGCYSPKLIQESDLYLSEYVIEAHYLEVYQRLVKGFGICRENPFESHIDENKKTGFFSVYEKTQVWVGTSL